MEIVYYDNHVIIANKEAGELVQSDCTGDVPLVEMVREWIRVTCNKPGNVFCNSVHRIDRPTWGLVVLARTSKGLSRMSQMFRNGQVHKTYWAIVKQRPPKDEDTLVNYVLPQQEGNFTQCATFPMPGSQKAILHYKIIGESDTYHLLEIQLMTGRKHQIRTQLATIGCPIKGDVKYGFQRGNDDRSICLQSHRIEFEHPVSHKQVDVTAPLPTGDPLWRILAADAVARGNAPSSLLDKPDGPMIAEPETQYES